MKVKDNKTESQAMRDDFLFLIIAFVLLVITLLAMMPINPKWCAMSAIFIVFAYLMQGYWDRHFKK